MTEEADGWNVSVSHIIGGKIFIKLSSLNMFVCFSFYTINETNKASYKMLVLGKRDQIVCKV